MSTAVFVVYATRTLDLDWIPEAATVVVVHNDDAFDRATLSRPVVHVDAPGNVGFGAGVNLALPHATGARVVLCNPDLVLAAEHWHAMTAGVDGAGVDEDVVVTVPLHDESGAPTSTSSRYPTPISQLVSGCRLGRWFPRGSRARELGSRALGSWGRAHDESLREPVGAWPLAERWVSGAALSVDVDRLRAVGGFDEEYFLYSEDVDLCARLARRYPSMRAEVADVAPGVHSVGASATGDSARVERIRLDSAIRYADAQSGVMWSACSALLRARRAPCSGDGAPVTRVALVSLGRGQAMGEVRRVASWRQLFAATGAEVVEVTVAVGRLPHLDGVVPVVGGRAAPERLAWSWPRLHATLSDHAPDLVVVVSTRAFDPRMLDGPWVVVLDQVDSLARSYDDRVDVVDGMARRVMYRTLSAMHARVERKVRGAGVRRVAAGWSDALTLGAEWVPNLVDPALAPASGTAADADLLFFGTLRYPPNVDALEHLARVWPQVQDARPGTTAIVAGAAPVARVHELCREHGWELVADFASLSVVGARAGVAVAPLSKVAGIQNKVLDATSIGLPQVVTPEALEGFDPEIPLVGHRDDSSFVAEVVRLLEDGDAARAQVATLREHFAARYSATAWQDWAAALFDHGA